MKVHLLLTLFAILLSACSHIPQPYGTAFPINHSTEAQEQNK